MVPCERLPLFPRLILAELIMLLCPKYKTADGMVPLPPEALPTLTLVAVMTFVLDKITFTVPPPADVLPDELATASVPAELVYVKVLTLPMFTVRLLPLAKGAKLSIVGDTAKAEPTTPVMVMLGR